MSTAPAPLSTAVESPTPHRRPVSRVARVGTAVARDDGAATAEYAITIMAAVGFAGLLVAIMRSGEVRQILTDLVQRALTFAG